MVPEDPQGAGRLAEQADADSAAGSGGMAQRHSSLLDVDLDEVCETGTGGGAQNAEASGGDTPRGADQTDDSDQTEPAEGEDGGEVHDAGDEQRGPAPAGIRKPSAKGVVTRQELQKALKLTDGDSRAAAALLGLTPEAVRVRISSDPELRAVWLQRGNVEPPGELEVLNRETPDVSAESVLGEAIQSQNRAMLRDGLEEAGILPSTLQKLKIFDKFGTNSGNFLVASLDLSHKMMVYGNVTLLEEADHIRATYLNNESLGSEYKIEWQKAYNDIMDIIGKNYERVLAGTQAMAKMMKKDNDEKPKKTKPGFKPLKAVKRNAR